MLLVVLSLVERSARTLSEVTVARRQLVRRAVTLKHDGWLSRTAATQDALVESRSGTQIERVVIDRVVSNEAGGGVVVVTEEFLNLVRVCLFSFIENLKMKLYRELI